MNTHLSGDRLATRQGHILDAVINYGYFAPSLLAREEEFEKMLHASSLYAQLGAATPEATRRPLVDIVRRRLGNVLIFIGTRLQAGRSETGGDASAIPAAWSAAITEAR